MAHHRPCLFARKRVDAKGKVRRYYPDDAIRTPYEMLKALPDTESYLRECITFEQLDVIVYAISDNGPVRRVNEARVELFQSINRSRNPAA